jgi:hypothetical protein
MSDVKQQSVNDKRSADDRKSGNRKSVDRRRNVCEPNESKRSEKRRAGDVLSGKRRAANVRMRPGQNVSNPLRNAGSESNQTGHPVGADITETGRTCLASIPQYWTRISKTAFHGLSRAGCGTMSPSAMSASFSNMLQMEWQTIDLGSARF